MNTDDFPDRPARPGSLIPPATINNVAHLLSQRGIACRYNEVTKRTEINIPGHTGTSENLDNVTMTAIVSLAAQHGMATGHIGEYVNAIADRNAYNPVANWIDSKPWDGIDRLPEILDTIVEQPGYPPMLNEMLVHKWFRSAAAAAQVKGYKGRGVLTFQGPQGIGKTSWVKALVPEPALRDSVVKLDHHLDGSNKDSVLGAVANWIVEIGELDSSFKKDVARLKGFITSDSDRVRRPYARSESVYERRTLFVATVNEANFLVDNTGNSRWWTIAVEKLDYGHTIDMQQLFAQMAAEVRAGEPWWLNPDEERLLAAWNSQHVLPSVVADAVHACLDLESTNPERKRVTARQLLLIAGIANPSNPQARECGSLLRELFGPPSRVRGSITWLVPVREPTADDLYDKPPSRPKAKPQDKEKEIF